MNPLFRKIDKYLEDYYERSSNALMVTGARQTGKTYSIREFGKNFENFIEINFIESPDAIEIFRDYGNASDIIFRITAFVTKPIVAGKTLIFFDEVQACPEIVTAIKFLVAEGSCRYILSGSLLGVELNDIRSQPVGYMGITEMYPMDFEEFVLNLGVQKNIIEKLEHSWNSRIAVDPVVHTKMIELLRLYLVVGGMPAAVVSYISTNNLQSVLTTQRDIISLYKKDITQYATKNKLKIKEIFDLIPSELDAKNKRFILKKLNEHAKYSRYEDSILWLTDAGVALPVYNVSEPKEPLRLSESRNLFKLFSSDVGLLCAQYGDGIQLKIIFGEKSINFGAVFENFAAQELKAHGFDLYYYNNKKKGELDFVISYHGEILPIEIKSGKDFKEHRALSSIMSGGEYSIKNAVVFSGENISEESGILYAPIYMLMFLKREDPIPLTYKIDLSALK